MLINNELAQSGGGIYRFKIESEVTSGIGGEVNGIAVDGNARGSPIANSAPKAAVGSAIAL